MIIFHIINLAQSDKKNVRATIKFINTRKFFILNWNHATAFEG